MDKKVEMRLYFIFPPDSESAEKQAYRKAFMVSYDDVAAIAEFLDLRGVEHLNDAVTTNFFDSKDKVEA